MRAAVVVKGAFFFADGDEGVDEKGVEERADRPPAVNPSKMPSGVEAPTVVAKDKSSMGAEPMGVPTEPTGELTLR